MLEAGLVTARFLHYAAILALFGLALFPLYTYPSRASDPPARPCHWLRRMVLVATLTALISAIAWGMFAVANMAGSLSAAADRDTMWSVFRETGFGQVWVARLALCAVLLALLTARMGSVTDHPDWVTPSISAVLLVSLARVGHTHANEGATRVIHMTADGAHLLAAGAWFGGLLALGYLLALARRAASPEHTAGVDTALVRFSGMGYVAVAVLVGSGLINTWFLVGSVATLTGTPYGQLLLAKLCLFAGMLALAATNRFWLVPSLIREKRCSHTSQSLPRLGQHVLGEQILGLLIVLIVSFLGTMLPADGSLQ